MGLEDEAGRRQGALSQCRGFLTDVRDALAGKEQDYTSIGIGRAITLLSIPMVLEMMMESVFTIMDVFFVSRVSDDAIAVVGITESVITLIYAVAVGLAMSTAAMVSRRIGEKNRAGARIAAFQAILLAVAVSLPISLAGILYGAEILELMGASPSVVEIGTGNMKVMLGGNLTIMLLFVINAVFRGAGNPAITMRVLIFSNLLNIILDPCFIFGLGPFPELGVTGAAVATTTGRGLGVVLQIVLLLRGTGAIKLRLGALAVAPAVIKRLARVSLGGIFQWIIATSSWILLMRIVASFGSEAVAGYTIGIRIIVFAIMPSWGMSSAAATLVGQNLGAGKPERAERSVWLTCYFNMAFLGMVMVVFLLFAESLVGLFNQNPPVLVHGAEALRYISTGYIFFALGMVITQSFNGAGDTVTPTFINVFCYWILQIPLAYALAHLLDWGPVGVYVAIALAEALLAVIGALVFRRGKWKLQQI